MQPVILRRLLAQSDVARFAGLSGSSGSTDGVGTNAKFNYPWWAMFSLHLVHRWTVRKSVFFSRVAISSDGTILVDDTDNKVIRQVTSTGSVTTLAGSGRLAWHQ
jgi:hypothetical protein